MTLMIISLGFFFSSLLIAIGFLWSDKEEHRDCGKVLLSFWGLCTTIALLLLVFALPAFAATWYANGTTPNFNAVSGGTTSSVWCSTATDGCGDGTWLDWSTGPATGDIFEADGVTGIVVNVNPKGTAGATKVHLKNLSGGGFTAATSATPITIDADITAGTTDALTVTGNANANPALTINGNLVASAGTSNANAVFTSHSVGTLVHTGNITGAGVTGAAFQVQGTGPVTTGGGTITGGSVAGAYGMATAAGANITCSSNCVAGEASGAYAINHASSGAITINANVTGGTAGGSDAVAAVSTGAGAITITGNIINGAGGVGARGKIVWVPSSAQKYIKFDGGGTAIFASAGLGSDAGGTQITAANTAAQVKTSAYFVKKDDGGYTQGTAGGGGGAWAF